MSAPLPNVSTDRLVAQALALCHQSTQDDASPLRLHLPHLQLEVHSRLRAYVDLCRRALIDTPLCASSDAASLRVVVADRQSSTDLVAPDFNTAAAGLGVLISALEKAGLDGCHDTEFDSWQFLTSSAIGVQLLSAPDRMPPWEGAFPLRNFLHWSYARQGRRLLHAGTLGFNGHGVLLAGAGGAGKSGTTLAGILGGLTSVGDDYIGLDPLHDQPLAFPVMRLMKQDLRGLTRLGLDPEPSLFGTTNWQGKHEFDFEQLKPGSRADQLTLKAVLLPHITGAPKSQLRPASQHEVLFALLPNNLQQLPGHTGQAMRVLTDLTRRLPGYHLELSADPTEINDTIRHFLERGLL